jgi:hypothetical protein
MSLNQQYYLPAIGSAKMRSIVPVHDDSIALSGLLVGDLRYTWKFALETLAEAAKRGSALALATGGQFTGLILVTSMTIRTDMEIESLSFSASSGRRDTLEVSMTLRHLPKPGALAKVLDLVSVGVGALADMGGN